MSLVVTKTPYRISFFGGGTDYPDWYREEGGQVLSTTIDKYCYVTCRYSPKYFPPQHRIVWSSIEVVNAVSDIRHPAVREALLMLGYDDSRGIEVVYHGDLPARSGMGSSSAFAAGLIRGLMALRQQHVDAPGLFARAIELEQQLLGENVGSQDQVAVSSGGLNLISFGPGERIHIEPFAISQARKDELNARLMLFYLGRKRFASDIAGEIIANLKHNRSQLKEIGSHVDTAASILQDGADLDDFGRLLNETWNLKRGLGQSVTNSVVDDVYAAAREHGALGGKLLGAGGTGFMLLYVPQEHQDNVAKALQPNTHVKYRMSDQGCSLIAAEVEDEPGAN